MSTVDKLYTFDIITLLFQIDRKQNSLKSVWLTRAMPVPVVAAGPGTS